MEQHLREIVGLSLSSTPEAMLKKALESCIQMSGACGGSILGEQGPYLQFLFSDVPELVGVRVPFDSIAGTTADKGLVVYTYAPRDRRHFDGVDQTLHRATKYLLSIPIPSIHATATRTQGRSAGVLQLLFEQDIFPDAHVEGGPRQFEVSGFRDNEFYQKYLTDLFVLLPILAFGMEVMQLRQTSYQAIHELKNKLISGLSWIGCLRDDLRQTSAEVAEDPAIRDDLEVAETSVREGAELAKTYLQFTKLYTASFAPASVNDILRETAATARSLAAGMGLPDLEVVTDLDPSVPEREIDAAQMKMAFFNLSKNAVEVLKERAVSKPCLTLKSASSSGRAQASIADNGGGMPAEIAENLFVAFKTKKAGGTGLGLTITKKIVDIHGGRIWCETGDWGTRFVVEV